MTEAVLSRLDRRLQSLHARQRLVIEADHEARALGDGLNLSRHENWYSALYLIRNTLRLMGLYRRGTQNAENPIVRHNTISSARLPTAFDGDRGRGVTGAWRATPRSVLAPPLCRYASIARLRSPFITYGVRADRRDALARRLLPRLRDEPGD
jgi:hypothetical protein